MSEINAIIEQANFGRLIVIDGKEWIIVHKLAGYLCLVIEANADLPCPVMLVQEEHKEKRKCQMKM